MSSHNHRAGLTHARQVVVSALLIVVAAATGCATTPEDSQPVHTAQDFCTPFLDYFRTDFPIDRVELDYQGGTGKPDQPLDRAITCRFTQGSDPQVSATVTLRPTKVDEDENGLATYVKHNGLVPLPGHEKEIWIDDARVKNGQFQTKSAVELATRVDPWVSGMTITDAKGSLEITDEQIGEAADLLITTTEAMSQ
ncbi:hypothetical protein FOH10_18950 [Nocardia otitidiscaviarum]|uniref:Uncharacterized protein n=1 Tax=Nocardia otitidiscaviarum TaxID=1823 RepID=A0A516NNK5_9NOCA|nr:hypothetical protein [Nocardia otitidiscaviarum]MCP9624286.1 hypothetical protein [Nocardia otitidiscaviarum]QDP80481.1 hypothetical protein FOH10_18950 [Nocardia otitidiscaviarum]